MGGQDTAADDAHVYGVGGVGIQDAKAGAIVVAEWRVGLQRAGTRAVEGAGRRSVGVHHGAPDGGGAETEKMAELVGEDGLEVVGLGRGGQRGGRCERDLRIAGAAINGGGGDFAELWGGWGAA